MSGEYNFVAMAQVKNDESSFGIEDGSNIVHRMDFSFHSLYATTTNSHNNHICMYTYNRATTTIQLLHCEYIDNSGKWKRETYQSLVKIIAFDFGVRRVHVSLVVIFSANVIPFRQFGLGLDIELNAFRLSS